ncbi:MAG: hypothetical protein [Caudoviricetes sp.]|nr:MAG: hypothetical protein [Caudoviricetes sp.]
MTIYKQPDAQAFAENAPSSEIATFTAWLRGLGIAFDETDGKPQMEGINDVLNRITQGIKYLEQYGIPLWRSDLEYPVGASVVYNGIQYRCIVQNTNARPDLSQNSWQSAIVDNLTSTSTNQALSANQGRVLANLIQNSTDRLWVGSTLIQWGRRVGMQPADNVVPFNIPFPNNTFVVIACNSSDGNSNSNGVIAYKNPQNTLSSFICSVRKTSADSSTDATWIAIGN